MSWHYSQNDEKFGPISIDSIADLLNSGTITDKTLLWTEGMAEWKSVNAFKRSPELLSNTDMAFCHESGYLLKKDDLIKIGEAYVSPERKNAYVQKLQEGTTTVNAIAGGLTYAGFWIRFVAKFVDGIIVGIVNWVLTMIIITPLSAVFFQQNMDDSPETVMALGLGYMALSYLITFTVGSAYNAVFLPKFGATPGKMITGLKVVRPDGSNISIGQAIGRYFAEFLSGMILLIGYIMAGFDDEARALHDRICKTRVVVK